MRRYDVKAISPPVGINRWAFKPEIGYSQRFGKWLVDAYGGVWFYTINSQSGNIGVFAINQNDGTLTSLGQAGDLPKSVGFNGIAAL